MTHAALEAGAKFSRRPGHEPPARLDVAGVQFQPEAQPADGSGLTPNEQVGIIGWIVGRALAVTRAAVSYAPGDFAEPLGQLGLIEWNHSCPCCGERAPTVTVHFMERPDGGEAAAVLRHAVELVLLTERVRRPDDRLMSLLEFRWLCADYDHASGPRQ